MPHVDEGRLHAYLDGALQSEDADAGRELERHLDRCADCRARLEDARRLRDHASGLLEGAAPDVAMPPFSEIRERAGRSSDAGVVVAGTSIRRRRHFGAPFGPLAWAASLVLALGLGWLLRDRMPERTERFAFEMPAAPAAPAAEPARRPAVGSAEPEALLEGAAEYPRPGTGDPRRTVEERSAASGRPAATADGQERTAAAAAPARTATDDGGAQDETPAAAAAPAEAESEARDFAVNERARAAAAADGARRSDAVDAVEFVAAEPGEWRVVDRSAAETALGTRLTILSDLPVVGYAVSQEGAAAVRVVQRLDEGTLVRLVQRAAARAAAPPPSQPEAAASVGDAPAADRAERAQAMAAEPEASMAQRAARAPALLHSVPLESLMIEAPAGWNARTRVHGGLVVTLEAPLPRDSLDALLTRLRER